MESKSVESMESPSADTTISNLSDTILCHILTFLPSTKEVVATTILSKRWCYLWTYVDKVRFDNFSEVHPSDGVGGKMQFYQFVYKVLQFLRAPRIKEMRLFCHERGCNEHDITTWISTAISRNVESLDMAFNEDFVLPFCRLNSQTLVTLKIKGACFSDVNFSRAPCLPSLKSFDLETDCICTNWLHSLISGCSALEYLRLNILWNGSESPFKISSATLLEFYVKSCFHIFKITLDTPVLKSLHIRGGIIEEILIESDLSYLSNAFFLHLIHSESRSVSQNVDLFTRFIRSLCNAEVLELNLWFRKPVTCDLNVQFHNLTTLVIRSHVLELEMLRNFMQNSNNLQEIHLETTTLQMDKKEIIWVEPERVPRCLLLSLRKMTIKGIRRLDELDVVEYVLNNGKLLEMMDIYCLSPIEENWQLKFQMLEKITMFAKASERCKTAFC